MDIKWKGTHIFADYTDIYDNEYILGEFIFKIMQEAVTNTSKMKIVHKKLCILNGETPPGMTSVLLLDESHFTTHAYSSEGLLMVDIATCGQTDTTKVIDYFNMKLKEKYPDAKRVLIENHRRFLHYV